MASLFSTVRYAMGDQFWFVKLSVAVFVLYYLVNKMPAHVTSSAVMYIFYFIIGFLFFGCALVAMSRNINNYLPGFPGVQNILEVLKRGICGLVVLFSSSFISCIIISLLFLALVHLFGLILPNLEEEHLMVLKISLMAIGGVIMLPFIFIPLVLYSARGKISDSFRFGIIWGSAGNFIMSFIVYLIQMAIIMSISYLVLFFFLKQIFSGESTSTATEILLYIYIVIAYFLTMLYFAELYNDVIPEINAKK